MNYTEAIDILRKYNEWRRYDGPVDGGPEMIDPKLLGEAIDIVVAGKDNSLSDIEQFRREAAKDILCAAINGAVSAGATAITKDIEIAVCESIKIADELIRQLKEGEQ